MIERADQQVLNYVSKAADAAHGVLRADQRLDFAKRLRARIEVELGGGRKPREVAKVLARFGDPAALVEREARRLAAAGIATLRSGPPATPTTAPVTPDTPAPGASGSGAAGPGTSASGPGASGASASGSRTVGGSPPEEEAGATLRFAAVAEDRDLPPGVREHRRIAQEQLNRRPGVDLPFAGLRKVAMFSANPLATDGRDARTIVKEHPRDAAAMVILVVAALLVPFDLPPLAIFQVPVVVWALGAALVLWSDVWTIRDKVLGIGAPMLGYSVGGVLIGGLRVGTEAGLSAFVTQFFDVSGTMFMIGTGLGVVWLAYRLLDVT
ncbi:hypothetical protein E1295_12270 [Nonomuraea mesophila]|uniref:Uncharacterized protein n=1 Tax=Nonomuraea mesophila TaxID=2530382 RepID=A0A4R5FS26_9ACTN|nr:hypothetical protein [Nonomuraea mesophila]TDE56020.1 hypothetical protein E1295_12270 [Nonomuraea mesophila]